MSDNSTRYFKDPDADARSLMMKHLPLCDGAKTGFECVHYWSDVCRMDAANSDELVLGEKTRRCMLVQGPTQNLDAIDMSIRCNQYEPARRSLLHPLRKTRLYDPGFDRYDPLTEGEVAFLRGAWQARKPDAKFDPAAAIQQLRDDVSAGRIKAPAAPVPPEPTPAPEGAKEHADV